MGDKCECWALLAREQRPPSSSHSLGSQACRRSLTGFIIMHSKGKHRLHFWAFLRFDMRHAQRHDMEWHAWLFVLFIPTSRFATFCFCFPSLSTNKANGRTINNNDHTTCCLSACRARPLHVVVQDILVSHVMSPPLRSTQCNGLHAELTTTRTPENIWHVSHN
jgi:hypothetical protein